MEWGNMVNNLSELISLYLEAQNYITVAYNSIQLVDECIKTVIIVNPTYLNIWVNNLINAREIMQEQADLMEFYQKKILHSKRPKMYLSLIYIQALNVSSIINLVKENHQKGISNFDPFNVSAVNTNNISINGSSAYLH